MKNLSTGIQQNLKPETCALLRHFAVLFTMLYAAAALFFCLAGTALDYQQGLLVSSHLAQGLKSGFGLLCLGVLFMECR